MLINLSPIRSDNSLEIIRTGETLKINGDTFDFSQLPEGVTLPEVIK